MTVDEELSALDDHMRRLKVEYDIYFGGGSKKPPADIGYRRPQDAMLGIQGMREEQQHEAEVALKHHAPAKPEGHFSVACSDVDSEPKKVEALFQALAEARQQTGEKNSANLESFKKFVRQKTDQLRKEYGCQAVEYSVELQSGKVKLKAKPKT